MSKVSEVNQVENCLKRIQGHKGVVGYIVLNQDGIPIKTTLDNSTTTQYAQLITQLNLILNFFIKN